MGVFSTASGSRKTRVVVGGVALLGATALVLSGCAPTEEGGAPAGDLTFKVGTALPVTGNLAFLGPPEIAGTEYAAAEVNEAAKGITIELTQGDSGDTDNKAYETEIPRLLGEGVGAIIGAASSGTSLQFIDQVVGANVIQFSPANTSAEFTTYDDKGLYFRTAPSDVLQGEVLGNLIAEDGNETLGMIVLNDSYGTGLASFTKEAFEAAGGEVVSEVTYNTGDTNFSAQISEVLAASPDAIALITFEEVATMIPEIVSSFPADKLYFVDGNLANFGDQFPAGTLAGAKGTLPGLSIDTLGDFTSGLNDFWVGEGNEELTEFSYAAESYDAVILLALASLAAGSTDPVEVAAKLQEVSGGSGDGTKCTTFAECADIINDGGVADYDGISGPITFDEVGDPTEATIGIYQYGEDNTYTAAD
ncbi:branched-chain amino acid transport system substrate-binding protein [Leifsonia sp. AK011]|uniref:ABC transporter substrate-binding protein n=1 Tax=Leifsonia sp. AK011 TaxID=2723075 RepID=UPI0015C743F8|nr:ABC transporter substrate-binding protein [Leifsonia sp. AK011]NYF09684.1 branched-chain amino acid transport system substrate-binding protein [Leifsonia sp. AK011]